MNSLNKNILSFNSLSDANDALLELFSELPKPISRILLSGGSTPISFYELLSKKDINWSNYLISLSDERRVEVSSSLSNEGTIKRIIYDHSFNNSFVSLLDDDSESKLNSIASYDLCILGMGNDGHIASIFPNMSNLEEALYGKASLLNIYDGYPDVSRVTMSLNEINKSDQIILLVKGEKKFNLLMDERANNNLLPLDHLFTQMINKIKVFKII